MSVRKLFQNGIMVEQPYYLGVPLTEWHYIDPATGLDYIVWKNGENFKDGVYYFRQSGISGLFLKLDPNTNTVDYGISNQQSAFYTLYWNNMAIFDASGRNVRYMLAEEPGVYYSVSNVLTKSATNVWAVRDGFIYSNGQEFYHFSFMTMTDTLIYTHANAISKRNAHTWLSYGCIFHDGTVNALYSLNINGTVKKICDLLPMGSAGYGNRFLNNFPVCETDTNATSKRAEALVGDIRVVRNEPMDRDEIYYMYYFNNIDLESEWTEAFCWSESTKSELAQAGIANNLSTNYMGLKYFRTGSSIGDMGFIRLYAGAKTQASVNPVWMSDCIVRAACGSESDDVLSVQTDIRPINTDQDYTTVRASQYVTGGAETYTIGPGWSYLNAEACGNGHEIIRLNPKTKEFESVNAEYYCYSEYTAFWDTHWESTENNIALRNGYRGAVVWNEPE